MTTSWLRAPATATVETWLKRRKPCASCARRASCATSSVPRRFTLRQLFSDLRLSDAAQWITDSVVPTRREYSAGVQTKTRIGEVAAKYRDARFEGVLELREIQMQLQRVPEAFVRLLLRFRAHQQIQPVGMAVEQDCGDMRADVAG